MAYRQVAEFGMSPNIGNISLPLKNSSKDGKVMYSDKLARLIDEVISGTSFMIEKFIHSLLIIFMYLCVF